MEREIVNRQEEALQGLEGVNKITASTREGRAIIELEFDLTMQMDRALMLVYNRLNQIVKIETRSLIQKHLTKTFDI